MIITIDGPAGTGKSTVAKAVARKLGFNHFDTGAIYRSFAWKVLRSGIDPKEQSEVIKLICDFAFEIKTSAALEKSYFVDGMNITESIRSPEISQVSSIIATYPEVRKWIVKATRKFGRSCNAVFEGRDMGSVVFPKADLKIFLTADPKIRAERRYKELLAKYPDLSSKQSLESILQEMQERDLNDSTRQVSPLIKPSDAKEIDTSHLNVNEVVSAILALMPVQDVTRPKMGFFYRLKHFFSSVFFKFFFRLEVIHPERVFPGGGILIANHTSLYDPFVIAVSVKDEVHFVTRDSFFEHVFLHKIVKELNTQIIGEKESDLKFIKSMLSKIESGNKVVLFPEGKLSSNDDLGPFNREFLILAKKAKCPVYPIYLHGVDQAWPQTAKFPKFFGKISVVFGTGVYFDEFEDFSEKEAQKAVLEKCREQILDLKKSFQALS